MERTLGNQRSLCHAAAVLLLALLSGAHTYARTAGHQPGDSLKEAYKQLQLENTARAKELFEAALRMDGNSIPAQIGLGRAAMQGGEWGNGSTIFDGILDQDSANTGAHYYAGICRREYGTQLAWLLRDMQWRKAEVHFSWVISHDSSYEDVLYQLAELLLYRGEYDRALDLGHRQIARRPDHYGGLLGLFKLYRCFVAAGEPGDVLDDLRQRHTDHARYFFGETLRRRNRFGEAEEVYSGMLPHPGQVPSEALYLSLARLSFAEGAPARGEKYYWQAVDRISSWLGAALLLEDIKYIATDAELAEYRSITSDRKKSGFFHRFWNLRNPAPAATTNARLAEHNRRFLYAEKNFEYYGSRSWFNNPDKMHYLQFPRAFSMNAEFNDKGLIYLRHGDPDRTERTMGTERTGGSGLHESWLYNATRESPRRIFHFAESNSVGNNWRLMSMPDDVEMMENLATWDYRYQKMASGEVFDQMKLAEELREESKATVSTALATDEHTWRKEAKVFAMPHSIDAFRSENGKTLLNISNAIPVGSLLKDVSDTLTTLRIEVGISIATPGGEALASELDTLAFALSPPPAGSYIELYRFTFSPDSVRIAMHARLLGTECISTWKRQMQVPGFIAPVPLLSDVELLLPSATKSSIEIDGVKVIASPFDAILRSQPLYVYWQIYNLTKDGDGKTKYVSRVLLSPGSSGPNDETVIAYEKNHEGREEASAEFARIDVRKFEKGVYTLTVQITDLNMVYSFSKARVVGLIGGE